MDHVASGGYEMVGTFNGNPLAMAADPRHAHRGSHARGLPADRNAARRDADGIEQAIADTGLTAHVVTAGAKGCVVFAAEPVTQLPRLPRRGRPVQPRALAFQHNGGVFLPPWGKIEQWLISVQHDEADIDRLIGNFAVFARAVSEVRADCGTGDAGLSMRLTTMAHPREGWQGHGAPRR